jgi:multiple sugar transport system substrate-binding protein
VLGAFAGVGSMLAAGSVLGIGPFGARPAAAATPGTGTGGYKLDLGGYRGPEVTTQPVTLRFMRQDYSPELNDLINSMYAKFSEAYPNITIKEERVPYGDLPKKVQVYVASGAAPDIMMGRNDFTLAYHAGKIALPLQDYFTPEYLADIFDNAHEAASVDKNLYCVPWETNTVFMYFNRDLFEKAGVPTPPEVSDLSKGWSVEEYVDALKRVKSGLAAKGITDAWALAASNYGNGGPGSNYTQMESIWIRSQGDPSAAKDSSAYLTLMGISSDGHKATGAVDTAEAIQGMKNYQSLFTLGLTPTGAVAHQFDAGVAATVFAGINQANWFSLPGGAPAFKWGTTPAPRGKIVFNANTSDSPLVWSKSPHPAEAVALLAFMCNDTNRVAFHKVWGSMPARKSLTQQIEKYKTDQSYQLAAEVGAASYSAPRTAGYFDYFNVMNPAVKDIALGADPAQKLKAAATKIDALLRKYS